MRERDKALEKNKKLLEERNEEILKLRNRLVEIESLYKASQEEINRLKSELNEINLKYEKSQRELSELKLKYTIKENALKELERLQASTSMPKFGGTIEVFCPECKSYHTIPYIPGRYVLCSGVSGLFEWTYYAIVKEDGTVETYPVTK